MNNKILTVSIAAYNVAKTLKETLDPFLECGVLSDLDIIIVNDGSGDETDSIANEYVEKFPETFRLINKENGGWGSTLNSGIENAKGKYFRQLDGDDYYEPQNMYSYIEFLKQTEVDLVVAPYIEYNDLTKEIMAEVDCNPGCEKKKSFLLAEIPTFTPFMHSMAIKTELLKDNVKITEHCFYTDTEFVLKSCNMVRTVAFFDKYIYCYRRATSGQSMSLSGFEKHYKDNIRVISVLLDYMNEYVKEDAVLNIYNKLLYDTCFFQYMIMLYIKPTREHKKDLIQYDKLLKDKKPEFYKKINLGTIQKLRKTKFMGYTIAAKHQMKVDKRFDEEGRMLY